MFFIFGMPRSGTTLLARMLNAHRDVLVPHETDFIVPMAFLMDRIPDPNIGRPLLARLICSTRGFKASLGEWLTEQDVFTCVERADYHAAAVVASLYGAMAARAGKRLAGDKSPNDLNFIRILDKTGVTQAPTRIIHIVRDVRDVMVSLHRTGWVPDLDRWFPRQWANQNLYLHGQLAGREHYFLLRYEDLVADPRGHAAHLCAWLGIPWDEGMLDSEARAHPRYEDMAQHSRLTQGVDRSAVAQYLSEASPDQVEHWHAQAQEALQRFGYV